MRSQTRSHIAGEGYDERETVAILLVLPSRPVRCETAENNILFIDGLVFGCVEPINSFYTILRHIALCLFVEIPDVRVRFGTYKSEAVAGFMLWKQPREKALAPSWQLHTVTPTKATKAFQHQKLFQLYSTDDISLCQNILEGGRAWQVDKFES